MNLTTARGDAVTPNIEAMLAEAQLRVLDADLHGTEAVLTSHRQKRTAHLHSGLNPAQREQALLHLLVRLELGLPEHEDQTTMYVPQVDPQIDARIAALRFPWELARKHLEELAAQAGLSPEALQSVGLNAALSALSGRNAPAVTPQTTAPTAAPITAETPAPESDSPDPQPAPGGTESGQSAGEPARKKR